MIPDLVKIWPLPLSLPSFMSWSEVQRTPQFGITTCARTQDILISCTLMYAIRLQAEDPDAFKIALPSEAFSHYTEIESHHRCSRYNYKAY